MKYLHIYVILSLFSAQVACALVDQEVTQHEPQNSWISSCSSTVTKGSKIATELLLMWYGIINEDFDMPEKAACVAAGLALANSDSLQSITPKKYIGEIPTALLAMLTSVAVGTYISNGILRPESTDKLSIDDHINCGLTITVISIVATGVLELANRALTPNKQDLT